MRRLSNEIYYRRELLCDAIREAKSIDELRASPAVTKWRDQYEYVEFKGRTLDELTDEYAQAALKVNVYPTMATTIAVSEAVAAWDSAKSGGSHFRILRLARVDFSPTSDAVLPALRKMADNEAPFIERAHEDLIASVGIPACGYGTVITRMISGQPTYLASMQRFLAIPPNVTAAQSNK